MTTLYDITQWEEAKEKIEEEEAPPPTTKPKLPPMPLPPGEVWEAPPEPAPPVKVTTLAQAPVVEIPEDVTPTQEGWLSVADIYAEQHPEAVVKIGDHYYRASVPSREFKEAKKAGKTTAEIYEAQKEVLIKGFEPGALRKQYGAWYVYTGTKWDPIGYYGEVSPSEREAAVRRYAPKPPVETGLPVKVMPEGTFYDLEKIARDEELSRLFGGEVTGGAGILYDYREAQKAVTPYGLTDWRRARKAVEGYTQLPDKKWISNIKLAEIEATNPDAHKALIDSGFVAANKVVDEQNAAIEKQIEEQQEALADLKPYQSWVETNPAMVAAIREAGGEPYGYDIARYLEVYPLKESTVLAAGFTKEQIEIAKAPPEVPKVIPEVSEDVASIVAKFDDPEVHASMSETKALIDAIRAAGFYEKTVIGTVREKNWGELTEEEKKFVAASYIIPGDIVGQSKQLFTGMTKLMYKAPTPALLQAQIDEHLVPLVIAKKYRQEYRDASMPRKLELLVEAGIVEKGSTLAGQDENRNPTYHPPSEPWTTKKVAATAGEVIVPFMYVARHAKELTPFGIAVYVALDVASFLPLIGWAGKVGVVSARTLTGATRGARAWQVVRSALYATRTVPRGMILFPYRLVRHPIQTIRGLGAITIEPVFHPLRTTKTLYGISTGRIQLGNIIPAGTLVTMGRAGTTLPLRSTTGNLMTASVPTTKPLVTQKPSREYVLAVSNLSRAERSAVLASLSPKMRVQVQTALKAIPKGVYRFKLPYVMDTKVGRVAVPVGDVTQGTYNRLLAEGKLPVNTIYDPKGRIRIVDPISGLTHTYTERVPTFTEWRVRPTMMTTVSTVKSYLTPTEYEIYKIMTIKGWSPPADLAKLDTASAARVRAASVGTVVYEHGYQTAIKMYGKNFVKAVFPNYKPKLKTEVALQKILAPAQAEERAKINKQVIKFVYEDLLGGTIGSEAEWNKLASAGFLQSPTPTTTLAQTVYPGRVASLAELASIPLTYTIATGGAWKLEPTAEVPRERLSLQYPVYITDPSIVADLWKLRTGTIAVHGENLPVGFVESEAEWKRLIAAGALEVGEKIELERYQPVGELQTVMPDPIGHIVAEEPVVRINPVTGVEEPGELVQLLQNKLIFAEFAPNAYTITSTGEMVSLAGKNYTEQATYLAEAIKAMVEEEGYGKALEVFGYLPVMAIYPYAIQMALAEEEATWALSPERRLDLLGGVVSADKLEEALTQLSPETRGKVLDSLKDLPERFTELGEPTITKPVVPEGITPERVAEIERIKRIAERVAVKPKLWEMTPEKRAIIAAEEAAVRARPKVAVAEPEAIVAEPEARVAEPTVRIAERTIDEELTAIADADIAKRLATAPRIMPLPITLPTPMPVPVPAPMKVPAPIPVPTPSLVTVPTPAPAPIPVPTPTPVPIPPVIEVPIIEPPIEDILWLEQEGWLGKKPKVAEGTIAWRQGIFWITMPPPYDKRFYSKKPPTGAYKFATGEESAYKTIQIIGGMPKKDIEGIDIGIAIVDIRRKGEKELTIHFKQDVEDAYKGKTIEEKVTTLRAKASGVPEYIKEPSGRIRLTGEPKVGVRKPRYTPFFSRDTASPQKVSKKRIIEEEGVSTDRYYFGHKLPDSNVRVNL